MRKGKNKSELHICPVLHLGDQSLLRHRELKLKCGGHSSEQSRNLFKAAEAVKFVDRGSRKQRAVWNKQKCVFPQGN